MGRRSTTLSCQNCTAEWWEPFEHLSRDDLIAFTQDVACPECDSNAWTVTFKSQFAGGKIKPNPPDKLGCRIRGFRCNDCRTDFHSWLGEVSNEALRNIAESISCPECESHDWNLTDQYKFISGTNPEPPIYFEMVSWDAPDNPRTV